jgi:hypothetical protein
MKRTALIFSLFSAAVLHSFGEVKVDEEAFGKSLGGWVKRDKATAEYPLSGATYRTYKPETSTTPEGGIFVSVRIDHVRGWLSSDDHAVLEITVSPQGKITSAQSSIAIQGKSITSDVILSGNQAGKALLAPEAAVQVGTDLIANLSEKLLREKIVEAGRVSFPAVLRHNYNKLFHAIRVEAATPAPTPEPPKTEPIAPEPPKATPTPPEKESQPAPAEVPKPENAPLEVKSPS